MRLRKFQARDYNLERNDDGVMLWVKFRDRMYGGKISLGQRERIEIHRAVGEPDRYYVYSQSTRLPFVKLQILDRYSKGLEYVDGAYFEGDEEIRDALGRRWENRSALRNTKHILEQMGDTIPSYRSKNPKIRSRQTYMPDQIPTFVTLDGIHYSYWTSTTSSDQAQRIADEYMIEGLKQFVMTRAKVVKVSPRHFAVYVHPYKPYQFAR